MEESFSQSLPSTSMPSLVSRLDRLDSLLKCLEGKKDDASAEIVHRGCVPLELALKEAQCKGSILDRIASLEDRLLQLYLDIQSEVASPANRSLAKHTFPDTNSPRVSRKGLSSSFSRFRSSHHGNKQASQEFIDKFEVRERKEQKPKHTESSLGKSSSKTGNHESASPKFKKIVPSSWLHLRLMGC